VRTDLRWLIVIAIVALLLTACTRNRAEPEPTATLTLPAEPVNATPSGADPAVEQATATPEGATAEASPSPTPAGSAETYEHRVQEGETLLTIAIKFNTDVETVRKLNFLIDDNIFVGQILQVPLIEGMTEDGAPTPTPEPYRYMVATGDTLNSIALRFDVSTVAIIEANGLLDPNSLVVGQEIIIPGYQPQAASGETASDEEETAAEPAAGATTGVIHVVQPGEGLLEIGRKYGIDANAIAEANNITNRNLLRVGQQLVIPGVSEQEAAQLRGTIHLVQAGESLLSIATTYGVTVAEIMQINNLANADEIFVGQELLIPTE
jgi:LysM repeat protein